MVNLSLTYQIDNTTISPGNSSGHSIISMSLKVSKEIKREGILEVIITYRYRVRNSKLPEMISMFTPHPNTYWTQGPTTSEKYWTFE